jgi:ribosomal protein S8
MACNNSLTQMINSIRVSTVAKKASCIVPDSRLNREFLTLLYEHGYLNGWNLGREKTHRLARGKTEIAQKNIYTTGIQDLNKEDRRICASSRYLTVCLKYASGVPVITNITMPQGQTPSTPRQTALSYRNMNNNVTSTYVLSTDKGLQLSTVALKNRTGGILICSIY